VPLPRWTSRDDNRFLLCMIKEVIIHEQSAEDRDRPKV
jgi:hypothetical protein